MAEPLKGARELQQFLDQLPAKLEANVLRGGLRVGAKVTAAAIKDAIPERSGELKQSVRVKTGNRRGVVSGTVVIGNAKAWYGRFLEFGTAPHEIRAKGEKSMFIGGLFRRLIQHPGVSRSRGKMRAAADGVRAGAIQQLTEYIRNRLRTKHGLEVPPGED